jgi:hypothetical protein
VVRLRGLIIHGPGTGDGPITSGIMFNRGAALFVENCRISNFTEGLVFTPPSAATARLFVSDTVVSDNQSGIRVGVQLGMSGNLVRATIDGVRVERHPGSGLVAGGGLIGPEPCCEITIVHMRNTVLTNNATGLETGPFPASATADRTSITLNGFDGVLNRPHSFVVLGRSAVVSNNRGVAGGVAGDNIFSYRNNHLDGNANNGAPGVVLSLK